MKNLHEFDNTVQGARNVSGIYRWVDKVYEAQIVNYGKRLILEFMIPEPAAFYKYAVNKKPPPTNVTRPDRPGFCREGVFYPLTPEDLQSDNYLCFVAKYNVKNLTPQSPIYIRVSDVLKHVVENPGANGVDAVSFSEINDKFKVPDGYYPIRVGYSMSVLTRMAQP